MKFAKRLSIMLISMTFIFGAPALAKESCSPKNINYCAREKSFFGGKTYFKYMVKCADGKTVVITAWNNRKKWCIGTTSQCSRDQLETAQQACTW